MNKWTDVSSYSQSDKERIPNVWELRIGKIRLVVHRHKYYEPDQWLMSVHGDVDIDKRPLLRKDIEEAQNEALQALYNTLGRLCREVSAILHK